MNLITFGEKKLIPIFFYQMSTEPVISEILRRQKGSISNQVLIYDELKKFIYEYRRKEMSHEEIRLISKSITVISMDIEIIRDRLQNIIDDIYDLQTETQAAKTRITNINVSISDRFLIILFIISYFTFIFIITRS